MVYSADLRWLIVYKRLVLGDDHRAVTDALEGICRHTQDDILCGASLIRARSTLGRASARHELIIL